MSALGSETPWKAPSLGPASQRIARDAPFRRALIVANPIAGRGKGAKAASEVEAGLASLGVPSVVHVSRDRGDARDRVEALGPETDLVVAIGGDGTLREVIEGLPDPGVPVGILPLGTANVLAAEFGLPRDVHQALEIMARKKVRRIDVARVNDCLSFMVTGIGLDGMAVRLVESRRRGPITKWSYVRAVLQTVLEYRPPRLRVEVDGHRLDGEYGLVLVSNLVNYGGLFNLDSDTRVDDGLIEVYLFPARSRLQLFAYALRGFLGRLPGGLGTLRRARHVRVESDDPVPYQVDGDYRGETPVEIQMADVPYHVLVP